MGATEKRWGDGASNGGSCGRGGVEDRNEVFKGDRGRVQTLGEVEAMM